jgi:hypothetical protein
MEFAGDQQSLVAALPGWAGMSASRPEAVMPFSFAVTFRFEVMGTRGRLTDYHVSAKNSRGGPAETDL